jgi:hypothetical protein
VKELLDSLAEVTLEEFLFEFAGKEQRPAFYLLCKGYNAN